MNDESFAWAPEDEHAITRQHNDAYAKMIADAHFEALLEDCARYQAKLRATRDSAAIAASNERFRERGW